MKVEELQSILALHGKWLKNDIDGQRANLQGANLQEANLRGANLQGANLQEANLRGANLQEANLQGANLRWANLRGANLRWANLQEANLRWANLQGADLRWANLQGANLQGADLRGANLQEADLRGANLCSPPMFLLAKWENVSDRLCIYLMRYDALNHPDPSKFDDWASGGKCPYINVKWQRCANFQEKRELWKPGKTKSALELATMLINECTKTND